MRPQIHSQWKFNLNLNLFKGHRVVFRPTEYDPGVRFFIKLVDIPVNCIVNTKHEFANSPAHSLFEFCEISSIRPYMRYIYWNCVSTFQILIFKNGQRQKDTSLECKILNF